MGELPMTSAANGLAKAEKLEQLRRKMAAIPARPRGFNRGAPAAGADRPRA